MSAVTTISEKERRSIRSHHVSTRFPQGDYSCWSCKVPSAWHGKDPRCQVIRLLDALEAAESAVTPTEQMGDET